MTTNFALSANAKVINTYLMAVPTHPPKITTRLLWASLILVVLTTLSTGIPAYWLTHRQLEEQTWKNIRNAQQATRSLLRAETVRLADLALLFAERPTLELLIQEPIPLQLTTYLEDFQKQSDLDILVVCQNGHFLAGTTAGASLCEEAEIDEAYLLDGQAALLATQTMANSQLAATTIVGRWLDNSFLQQLAASTGVGQSILHTDGTRLASSLPLNGATATKADTNQAEQRITVGNIPYFAAYTPIGNPPVFISEVALPVHTLTVIKNRTLGLLAISTGVVAILGVLIGSLTMRQLITPLQKLTNVADQISSGDLMAPIPLFSGPAEISTLATALHQSQASMLEALSDRSQARDWLNTLIHSIVEGVVTVDEAGRITFFSQGAETVTGWTATEAMGLLANEVFPTIGEDDQPFLAQLPTMGSKKQIAIRTRDGQHLVLAVTGAQLSSPEGATAEIVFVLRDISQEEALRHVRSYFLANISHEFRTPLSTLQASMELMLDAQENLSAAEMRELLQPSYLSLASLQLLIDNLLESGSIEAGQFVIQPRPLSLAQVLSQAQRIVHPLLERRQQQVAQQLPDDLPHLEADPTRITQVLVNLLTNASKYSPLGTVIAIAVVPLETAVRIMVTDQGIGIPASERVNVFRQFVRLDTADQEQVGIGLGLYIVKVIVEAHNGRVGVQDVPEGGSTFWFELPVLTEDETLNR